MTIISSRAVLSCIMCFACCAVSDELSKYKIASLLYDLKIRFQSDCIFLVNSKDFSNQQTIVDINKIVSENSTMMTILSGNLLNKTANEFRCQRNRPVFILLADDTIRNHLRMIYKIPSYPRWVLTLNPSQSAEEFLADIYVPLNCEMLVAEDVGSQLQLVFVYRVSEISPLSRQFFGTWSPQRGVEASGGYLYATRNDLGGLVLKTTTIQYPPITTLQFDPTKQRVYIDGFYGKIWQTLEERLNFSSQMVMPPENDFGVCKGTNCTGMMALLVNGDVQVGVNEFAYDGKRMDVFDFLVPIGSLRMMLFVRRPETIRFQWTSFLSPFSPRLWLGLLGSILISSATLSLGRRIEQGSWRFLDSMFQVLGLFCGQGDVPAGGSASFSHRVLLSVGVASVVVIAAYSGALTSAFTVQTPELPYDSVEEYVAGPVFELGISPNSFWVYLENATGGLAKVLRDKLYAKRNSQPTNRFAGFTKLCSKPKGFGWISSATYDSTYFAQFKCGIVNVPGYIMVDTVSIVVRKGSPYRKLFDYMLNLLKSSGIMSQLYQRTWPEPLSKLETMKPLVYFHQVVPIVAVLALGIVASVLLTFAEIHHNRNA